MIKIWLLISMISAPQWPSVRTIAEVHFEESACVARQLIVENRLVDKSLEIGLDAVFVETWCLETEMFIPFTA